MADRLKVRFLAEAIIGGAAGVLGILTIFWRDWIEAIFGFDPDHHNGSVEWVIVGVLLAIAIVLGLLARADWHRLAVPGAAGAAGAEPSVG